MPLPSTWPTEVESSRLAADLLAGRATASGEIATTFLVPLTNHLRRRFPSADSAQCETAASDALLKTVQPPIRFDPSQLTLGAFLRMVARRKMATLFARDNRHPKKISLEFVAEPIDHRNHSRDDDVPSWDDPRLTTEAAAFNTTETAVLELMRRGVRKRAAFATIPGLAGVTPNELAAEVKRYKDRIKKRLSRAVGGDK